MNDSLLDQAIPSDGQGAQPLLDWSIRIDKCNIDCIEVIFRNQEKKLISLINEFQQGAIFGCVAWLTSKPILIALSKCEAVQILVQKEDFLRPDSNVRNRDSWKVQLQELYSKIPCGFYRFEFKEPIRSLSVCCDPTVDAIRCLGNYNSDKNPAFPRMHHKFLVFCKVTKVGNEYRDYKPVAVWTGSFNLTHNATVSFENNLLIRDPSGSNKLLNAYLNEHHQLFGLSEPLNWTYDWVYPEYRIGT